MLKEIIIAVQSYYKAHLFIKANKLWKWIIIPGIIYALLFVVSMYFFGKSASFIIEWLSVKSGLKTWIENSHNRLFGFLFALGGLMVWLILLMLYFSWFKYIWLIIGSPQFSFLSEKTASVLEKRDFPVSNAEVVKGIKRGVLLSLRNFFWQSVYSVALLIVSFIPVVGWITPLAALFNECYYFGFSMIDYSCERQKLNSQESIEFISKHKGLSVGNGLVFYLMHTIPIIGWVLAPAYAVVAATISLHTVKEQSM